MQVQGEAADAPTTGEGPSTHRSAPTRLEHGLDPLRRNRSNDHGAAVDRGRFDLPFLLLSGDQLIEAGVVPPRRDPTGPFAWVSHMRPRFFDGLHRCIPALAAAGNNVLVEHVVEHRSWRTQLDQLLEGYDVFWVGVFCDLDEIDRREIIRGNRTRGEGRAHVERDRIHDHGPYHLHIDTTAGVTDTTAHTVINAWASLVTSRVDTGP